MKKGQQQEPLQDHIEDEINDAIHKVEEKSLFAPGCVRRAQTYRAHLKGGKVCFGAHPDVDFVFFRTAWAF